MEQLSAIAESLRPLSATMRELQTPNARWAAEGVHVAFLSCCLDAILWPDTTFSLECCLSGMRVLGPAQDHGLWPRRPPDEIRGLEERALPITELRRTNIRWNRQLKRTLEKRFAQAKQNGDLTHIGRRLPSRVGRNDERS